MKRTEVGRCGDPAPGPEFARHVRPAGILQHAILYDITTRTVGDDRARVIVARRCHACWIEYHPLHQSAIFLAGCALKHAAQHHIPPRRVVEIATWAHGQWVIRENLQRIGDSVIVFCVVEFRRFVGFANLARVRKEIAGGNRPGFFGKLGAIFLDWRVNIELSSLPKLHRCRCRHRFADRGRTVARFRCGFHAIFDIREAKAFRPCDPPIESDGERRPWSVFCCHGVLDEGANGTHLFRGELRLRPRDWRERNKPDKRDR